MPKSTPATIRIDIVSDVVCPWCIIGYKRLQLALNELADTVQADVHWHPFELNPQMPEQGQELREHLTEKYGTTTEDSIRAREMLTRVGNDLGFAFDYFDGMKILNTFKAHQLLHHAREHGLEQALKLRLFAAFFSERQDIGQADVLVEQAARVGLDPIAARAVLDDCTHADAVRSEQGRWMRAGVRAVPTFVFNGQYGVSGAREPDALKQVILAAIAQAAPTA